jgi:hypothetical protein
MLKGNKNRAAGGRFAPGQSGNPRGRPVGARNRITTEVEQVILAELPAIAQKLVERAKDGHTPAGIALLRTIVGAARERSVPIRFGLPELNTPADAVEAMRAIARGIADGELTGDDARALTLAVNGFTKATESHDHSTRLAAIEDQLKPKVK